MFSGDMHFPINISHVQMWVDNETFAIGWCRIGVNIYIRVSKKLVNTQCIQNQQ